MQNNFVHLNFKVLHLVWEHEKKNLHSKRTRQLRWGDDGVTPAAKKFTKLKKNAKNVLKQKNMQKYLPNFLQGYPLKSIFPLEPTFCL